MGDPNTLTEAGWPRPIVDGWPIPWVSPPEDLSYQDADRMQAVYADLLCQVCGLPHEADARVFLCVSAENEGTDRSAVLSEQIVLPMDNGVLHEHCARLAVARCPVLREIRAKGALIVLSAPVKAVERGEIEGRDQLAVPGSVARVEAIALVMRA